MTRISPARASARGHMLMEAAEHLRMEVCDNGLERKEANKIADRLEREADKWFARGLTPDDDYEECCLAEIMQHNDLKENIDDTCQNLRLPPS